MKSFYSLFLLLIITRSFIAQSYDYSVGGRWQNSDGLFPIGISGKKALNIPEKHSNYYLEGILQLGNQEQPGIGIIALLESHRTVEDKPNFHPYYGVGGHCGVWNYRSSSEKRLFYGQMGIDLVIGIEFTLPKSFILGLDWKPKSNFYVKGNPEVFMRLDQVGISVRYIPINGQKIQSSSLHITP